MAGASEREQASFLEVHRGLYERSHGVVRLAIRDGMLALRSLSRPGFASGAVPDWDALAPMRAPVSAAPFATPRSEPAATGSSM
jgi:hypothetical protein